MLGVISDIQKVSINPKDPVDIRNEPQYGTRPQAVCRLTFQMWIWEVIFITIWENLTCNTLFSKILPNLCNKYGKNTYLTWIDEEPKSHFNLESEIRLLSGLYYLIPTYRNYWNRSRPCIILDSKIPRLVLEVFQKV